MHQMTLNARRDRFVMADVLAGGWRSRSRSIRRSIRCAPMTGSATCSCASVTRLERSAEAQERQVFLAETGSPVVLKRGEARQISTDIPDLYSRANREFASPK
jgi:hypothetical protein